jgi:hypothetical protein
LTALYLELSSSFNKCLGTSSLSLVVSCLLVNMECGESTLLANLTYGLLNSLSLIACSLLTFLYLKDPCLSSSPGKLIASMEATQLLIHFLRFDSIPIFRPYLEPHSGLCQVISFTKAPLILTVWTYGLSVNFEVLMKVQFSAVSNSCVPQWAYHLLVAVLSLAKLTQSILYGEPSYSNIGCILTYRSLPE